MFKYVSEPLELRNLSVRQSSKGNKYALLSCENSNGEHKEFYVRDVEMLKRFFSDNDIYRGNIITLDVNFNNFKEVEVVGLSYVSSCFEDLEQCKDKLQALNEEILGDER